jgi:hypothetical protein
MNIAFHGADVHDLFEWSMLHMLRFVLRRIARSEREGLETLRKRAQQAQHENGYLKSNLSKKPQYFQSLSSWLPFLETYRTMCGAPGPDFKKLLEDVAGLPIAA